MGSFLSPEALAFDLALGSDPQLSPGGERIVYTLTTVDASTRRLRRRIWTCAAEGGDPRPLVPGAPETSGARWSADGARIAFVSADADGSALTVVRSEGAVGPRQVVRHAQGIGELDWSPDGRRIAYTTLFDPDNPDERPAPPGASPRVRVTRRLDYKEDGRGYLGDRRSHVFIADLADAESRRVTSEPLDHDSPRWSPDGSRLVARVHLVDRLGDQLLVLDPDAGELARIGPGTGAILHWAWSPDGGRVLLAADPDHALQPDYYVHHCASGRLDRVTDDLGPFPDDAPPVWLDGRRVLIHAFDAGASSLQVLDVQTGEVSLLERSRARHAGLSADAGVARVVQGESSPRSVGEIRLFDRHRGTARTVTAHNAGLLEERPPAVWEELTVSRGELTIDAWLLAPPNLDPDRRYPVVLDVHGGPNASYGYGFLAHEQCLATAGFLVVFANPRGSTSYGRSFAQEVVRDWGGGDYEDLMAVLDEVLTRPYADADRTGIFGFSYGGYLTAWAISQTQRFRAAVCGEPIFDLESDYGTSDLAFNGLEHYAGGAPHEERDWYESHSPSSFSHRIRTPTLIVHGEDDHRCPIGQSEQMFVALRKAGCEVEFARYPGGSHMFFAEGLPEHRADFLARTLAWFKRHLGEPC